MREDFDRALLPRVQMLEISGYGEAKDARRGWAEIHTSHCFGALYGNPGQLRAAAIGREEAAFTREVRNLKVEVRAGCGQNVYTVVKNGNSLSPGGTPLRQATPFAAPGLLHPL